MTANDNRSKPPKVRNPLLLSQVVNDEDGSSMVFGVLSMLTLATSIALVFNVGVASIYSQESQNAADAAAYSGALVAANNLNAIAEMNDAMSVVYYSMMRYSIDAITFGVLANIAQHKQYVTQNNSIPSKLSFAEKFGTPSEVNPSPLRVYGMNPNSFLNQFNKGTSGHIGRCQKMIDAGEEWIKALAEAERALAKATPKMIETTIHEIVQDNFSKTGQRGGQLNKEVYVSIFPKMEEKLFFGNDKQSLLRPDDNGGGLFSERFAQRYEYRHPFNYNSTSQFDGGPVPTPAEWYSSIGGKSTGEGYFQVRVCWNFHDFIHSAKLNGPLNGKPTHGGMGEYSSFGKDAPNGHWHPKHGHSVPALKDVGFTYIPIMYTVEHYSGHGSALVFPQDIGLAFFEDIPPDIIVDPIGVHLYGGGRHHEVIKCPTCIAKTHDNCDYSTIKAYERPSSDANGGNLDTGPFRVSRKYRELFSQAGNKEDLQPLILNPSIANFGINVAVAVIPERDVVFAPKLFTNPESGFIAMASAKVGLVVDLAGDKHEIEIARNSNASNKTWISNLNAMRTDNNNMFITNGEHEQDSQIGNVRPEIFKDTYFSARLTPMTLDCWGSSTGGSAISFDAGMQALLLGNNWTTPGNPGSATGNKVSTALTKILNIDNSVKEVVNH